MTFYLFYKQYELHKQVSLATKMTWGSLITRTVNVERTCFHVKYKLNILYDCVLTVNLRYLIMNSSLVVDIVFMLYVGMMCRLSCNYLPVLR